MNPAVKGQPAHNRAPAIPKGTRFTRLSIDSDPIYKNRKAYYRCVCDCGKSVTVQRAALIEENTRSCGCLFRETSSATITRLKTTHGMSRTTTYSSWQSMIARCTNPNTECFPSYGGRGIKVFRRWVTFEGFFRDMGECPEGMSLGRIDNDGNYEPKNCRWETNQQQANNRRSSHMVPVGGAMLTVTEAARRKGIAAVTIFARLYTGWDPKRAVETPVLRPCYSKK